MKISKLLALFGVLILLLTSPAYVSAAPPDNAGKGPLDKTVFVHYPRPEPARPAKPGPGGTGTLSSDYKYSGVHWANPAVSYYVNPANSGVDTSITVAAIRASFDTWDNASGALSYTNVGTTALAGGNLDGYNVVSWADISSQYPGAIAVTIVWSYRYNKQIAEVDTLMNIGSGFTWSYTAPDTAHDLSGTATADASRYTDPSNGGVAGTYDIRNIMTHEAGHWLMLGDLYNSTDNELTMYGYGSTGQIKKDTLGYGDELGVERIYGP